MINKNSETRLFLAIISQDGTYKKEIMADYTNEKEKVNPFFCKEISPGQILLYHVHKMGRFNVTM
jgi:hypothetical protein